MNYTLEDFERLRAMLEDTTGIKWEIYEIRRWWKDEAELTSCSFRARIDDISIIIESLRESDGEGNPVSTWSKWWSMLQRPHYLTRMTGGTGDTPLETWENLQPRLQQWIYRPHEVEEQLS